MNISGIRTNAGFYDYNIMKQNEIRSQQIQEAKANANGKETPEVEEVKVETADVSTREDFGARDFASRYQPDAVYDLKGTDSDILKLDIEKAISDMRKDAVLEQYQFFVGKNMASAGTDFSAERETENFML